MINKVIDFLRDGWNHYWLVKMECLEYQLKWEIRNLEGNYRWTGLEILKLRLEYKRQVLENVSRRLALYREKMAK